MSFVFSWPGQKMGPSRFVSDPLDRGKTESILINTESYFITELKIVNIVYGELYVLQTILTVVAVTTDKKGKTQIRLVWQGGKKKVVHNYQFAP